VGDSIVKNEYNELPIFYANEPKFPIDARFPKSLLKGEGEENKNKG